MTILTLIFLLGFCRLTPHPRSPGTWTIYFEGADYESHLSHENAELVSIDSVNNYRLKSWQAIEFYVISFSPY